MLYFENPSHFFFSMHGNYIMFLDLMLGFVELYSRNAGAYIELEVL